MDEEVVDLTALTPRTDLNEEQEPLEAVSLLTPETENRNRLLETPQDGSPLWTLPSTKKQKANMADLESGAGCGTLGIVDDRSRGGSVSPVAEAMRRYIEARLEGIPKKQSIQQPSQTVADPPSGPHVEDAAEEDKGLSLRRRTPADAVPDRRQLHKGDDELIIEICHETEQSWFSAALIRKLDDAEKDKQSFCCLVHHESLLPGRKCISWLTKRKKKTREGITHERMPYMVILLQAEELIEEIVKDKLGSFLFQVSRSYPDSRLGILIIGLDSLFRKKRKRPLHLNRSELEALLVDVFVDYTGVVHRVVRDMDEAAEHVVHLSNALLRISHSKYDLSFLTVFGGCKSTEAINIVDLKLNSASQPSDICPTSLLEWINLLHAIPGIGPKDAHAIALEYPSFSALMEAYRTTSRSEEEKRGLVADTMQPPENKRRIGTAASRALYSFFCNTQPDILFGE